MVPLTSREAVGMSKPSLAALIREKATGIAGASYPVLNDEGAAACGAVASRLWIER